LHNISAEEGKDARTHSFKEEFIMALTINTNMSALNAQRNLTKSQGALSKSMERLSSGMRINSAKDDAAGLAIAARMTSQVRGLNQAVRNANDGISLAQTAEGALQESTNILQRMRELAVQSANDSNSSSDRGAIQKEVAQLQSELNRIADQTTFNNKNLLDGTFTAQKFHVGTQANETISISVGSARATTMGAQAATSNANVGGALTATTDVSGGNNVAAQNLVVSGAASSGNLAVIADDAASDIADLINGASATTGVTATAATSVVVGTMVNAGTVSFTLSSSNAAGTVGSAAAISASVTTTDLSALVTAINDVQATTGITATLSTDGASLTLTNDQGYNINILNADNSGSADDANVFSVGGVALVEGASDAANVDSIVVGGQISTSSNAGYTITTDTGTTVLGAASVSSSLDSVADVDVSTQAGANDALNVIDEALNFISSSRADLGAVQNRMESTIANLMAVSENVSAARARITDADIAMETTEMTKANIMQQAGVAILAQANQTPQLALSLLQ
jgi:flagellin